MRYSSDQWPNNSPEPAAVCAESSASRSITRTGGGSLHGRYTHKTMKRTFLLLLAYLLVQAHPVVAEDTIGSISFKDAPAAQVLSIYQKLSGLELVMDSRATNNVMASITLEYSGPKAEGLKRIEATLLAQTGIAITKLDDKRALVSLNEATYFAQPASSAAQPSDHHALILLSSQDVDTNSVRLCTQASNPVQNVTFRYINKSSAEIKSIAHTSDNVAILNDGVFVLRTDLGTTGFMHGTNYIGLVLIFDHDVGRCCWSRVRIARTLRPQSRIGKGMGWLGPVRTLSSFPISVFSVLSVVKKS